MRPTASTGRTFKNPGMTSPKPPEHTKQLDKPLTPEEQKPGTNETQHEPDPQAEPIPNVDHRYHPRSPYTAGNS